MKKLHLLILLITNFAVSVSHSEDTNIHISWIKQEYKIIRENLKNFYNEPFEGSGKSTEGNSGWGYVDKDGNIRFIEVTYYGETGKSYFEYYYYNGKPFFILYIDYTYNAHIMMTEEEAENWYKQDGVKPEVFDQNKTRVEEYRYYINNNKIIRILPQKESTSRNPDRDKMYLDTSLSAYKILRDQIQLKKLQ